MHLQQLEKGASRVKRSKGGYSKASPLYTYHIVTHFQQLSYVQNCKKQKRRPKKKEREIPKIAVLHHTVTLCDVMNTSSHGKRERRPKGAKTSSYLLLCIEGHRDEPTKKAREDGWMQQRKAKQPPPPLAAVSSAVRMNTQQQQPALSHDTHVRR